MPPSCKLKTFLEKGLEDYLLGNFGPYLKNLRALENSSSLTCRSQRSSPGSVNYPLPLVHFIYIRFHFSDRSYFHSGMPCIPKKQIAHSKKKLRKRWFLWGPLLNRSPPLLPRGPGHHQTPPTRPPPPNPNANLP